MNRAQENELIRASAKVEAEKALREKPPSVEWIVSNLRFIKYTGKVEVVFRDGEVVTASRVEE